MASVVKTPAVRGLEICNVGVEAQGNDTMGIGCNSKGKVGQGWIAYTVLPPRS